MAFPHSAQESPDRIQLTQPWCCCAGLPSEGHGAISRGTSVLVVKEEGGQGEPGTGRGANLLWEQHGHNRAWAPAHFSTVVAALAKQSPAQSVPQPSRGDVWGWALHGAGQRRAACVRDA